MTAREMDERAAAIAAESERIARVLARLREISAAIAAAHGVAS